MSLCIRKMLLVSLGFLWMSCGSANDGRGVDYIQGYIDSKIGFDSDVVIEEIKTQQRELARHASIASRVNREMVAVQDHLSTPGSRAKLQEYVDGLSEEERNAPDKVQEVVASMKQSMETLFEALSVQLVFRLVNS